MTTDGPSPATLERFGWTSDLAQAFQPQAEQGLVPGRVGVEHRGSYVVHVAGGEVSASVSGRFRHAAKGLADFPAVGDWVGMELRASEGTATIQALLPRSSWFSRKARGVDVVDEQVVAANVDTVFIVGALNNDYYLPWLERYLTLAWSSGADPVVVLNKSDLCDDIPSMIAEVGALAAGAPIHALSAVTAAGLDALAPYLRPGRTVALLGASGVGKSTLVNALIGHRQQDVAEIREKDQQGRHTTRTRELFVLPSGGLLIDTPGMRLLELWEGAGGLEDAFPDVEGFVAACRFTDCRHESEPGCAVRSAVADGRLPESRLASYLKLEREMQALEARRDQKARAEARAEARRRGHMIREMSNGAMAAKRHPSLRDR